MDKEYLEELDEELAESNYKEKQTYKKRHRHKKHDTEIPRHKS